MSTQNVNTILFINNDGAGFSSHVQVVTNTSIGEFFKQKFPSGRPQDYTIRITRAGVKYTPTESDLLLDGDRISVLPRKVEGA